MQNMIKEEVCIIFNRLIITKKKNSNEKKFNEMKVNLTPTKDFFPCFDGKEASSKKITVQLLLFLFQIYKIYFLLKHDTEVVVVFVYEILKKSLFPHLCKNVIVLQELVSISIPT